MHSKTHAVAETGRKLDIEVAFALPAKQKVVSLRVSEGTPVLEAITLSGIKEHFRRHRFETCEVGIFGNVLGKRSWPTVDQYQLQDGDRIEIYRPIQKK